MVNIAICEFLPMHKGEIDITRKAMEITVPFSRKCSK